MKTGTRPGTADLKKVMIKDAFWDKYTRLVTDEVIPYQWKVLNDELTDVEPSHSIRNFRIAAGKESGDFYGFVFQDSDLAKWLEAVAYSLAWKPDEKLEQEADAAIDLLSEAQQPDGYLDTYFIIRHPGIEFTNLWEGHELYCAGHLIEAGVAYFNVTGKRKLLDICCRMADHIVEEFHTERLADAIPGHEEIELALIRLYEVTGEEKYLEMACEFLDRRGRKPNYFITESTRPGWMKIFSDRPKDDSMLDYSQTDEPVRDQRTARGHAVRAVYLYCAMADAAFYKKDESLLNACRTLYDNIVKRQMYITGGIGSSGILERFTVDYDLPNDMNYSESCASIGLALFCRRMAQITGEARYMDTAETALYNTVLAGIAMDGQSFFYVNPLAVWPAACMNHTSREHVKAVRQKWFACACCPPNIARTLAGLGEYCYFTDEEGISVNFFVSGSLSAKIGDKDFTIRTETPFPFASTYRMTLEGQESADGTLRIRIPGYAQNYAVSVNGERAAFDAVKGYAVLRRTFSPADVIEVSFDMPAQFMHANPLVRADAGRAALKKGPLVYCLEQQDNGENLEQLMIDPEAAIEECFDPDQLGGTLFLRTKGYRNILPQMDEDVLYAPARIVSEPAELVFAPYAYWGNRTPGEMSVWVREKV